MASIEYYKNKNGNITSYKIKIARGYDNGKKRTPYTKAFKASTGKTNKEIEKEAKLAAVKLEEEIKQGYILDNKQTFAKYAEYVIALKERSGVKHSTIFLYRGFLKRVNQGIGHLKLSEIRPQHLNMFYEQLSQEGLREGTGRATTKVDLRAEIREHGFTFKRLADAAGIAENTVAKAVHGEKVAEDKARAIAKILNENADNLFDFTRDMSPLSNKTILEYHRFISAVLAQAEKEMIILYNPAAKASPPKYTPKEAEYFEPEEVKRILDCAEQEPIKWRTAIHLLAVTGARRGEVVGLKWDDVDFKNNTIHIKQNLFYTSDKGVYEETPKTEKSNRYINLPIPTIELLREYQRWQQEQAEKYGDRWVNTNYIFTQENGEHMNPSSFNQRLRKFSERFDLPEIYPHKFRHTVVSILINKRVDNLSISRRVGHTRPSTTLDKYGHMLQKAEAAMTKGIADVLYSENNTDEEQE